jgi:hypothetical protein
MNRETLRAAILAAEKFVERAEDARKEPIGWAIVGTKQSAAARRASMELTRALAEMRRAN